MNKKSSETYEPREHRESVLEIDSPNFFGTYHVFVLGIIRTRFRLLTSRRLTFDVLIMDWLYVGNGDCLIFLLANQVIKLIQTID